MDMTSPESSVLKSVLIILPEAIGDAVMSSPAVMFITQALSSAKLVLLCNRTTASLYERLLQSRAEVLDGFMRMASANVYRYDLIIDMRSTSDVQARLSETGGVLARHEFGGVIEGHHYSINGRVVPAFTFVPGWDSNCDSIDEPAWALDMGLAAAALGVACPTLEAMYGYYSHVRQLAVPRIQGSTCDVLLVPVGSNVAKRWPPKKWRRLASLLSERGLTFAVALGTSDPDPVEDESRHLVLRSLHLGVLLDFMSGARLVIANDCGPMHVAAISSARLCAIFGPTNERIWFPYREMGQRVVRSGPRNPDRNGFLIGTEYWTSWPEPEEILKLLEQDLESWRAIC